MKFKPGDKVKLTYKQEITGTVKQISNSQTSPYYGSTMFEYLIKYDGEGLIPVQDWHPEKELELIEELPQGVSCTHVWKTYNSGFTIYEYCEICDEKRS